jgi:hypothetical protein
MTVNYVVKTDGPPVRLIKESNRQAIITRRTESGYTANAQAGRVRVAIDFSVNAEDRHAQAAYKLIAKMDWDRFGTWHGAWLPDGNSMAWVCAD